MKILFELIAAHAIADYGLQTAYMAAEKSRSHIVMVAHGLIHGFMVSHVLKSNNVQSAAVYGACEAAAHACIDCAKVRYGLCEWMDQALHILCKLLIAKAVSR